jgi:DNA polymerase-3 subunit delta'
VSFSRDVALDYLRQAHQQNRLAHAYLISGDANSGKRQLAADLARLVNRLQAEEVFRGGSDVYLTEPESKSRRIVIEQIRELEHALQMRAPSGRQKVAIIAEADRLQPQAANAFLKTLEEPPNDSLLLLLSALPEVLPDTIISRCIEIQLAPSDQSPPSEEETHLVHLLGTISPENFTGVKDAFRIVQGFQRSLAKIRETIQEENAAALKRDEMRYKNTTDGSWLENREDHYKALTESLYLQKRARLMEVLFRWWSDVLRANSGVSMRDLPVAREQTEAIARRLSTGEILQRIRRLEELRDYLGRNIQEALALEVTFLKVFRF